jgi:hypothetical protein
LKKTTRKSVRKADVPAEIHVSSERKGVRRKLPLRRKKMLTRTAGWGQYEPEKNECHKTVTADPQRSAVEKSL